MQKFTKIELKRLIDGDEEAFRGLFEEYYIKMVQKAASYLQEVAVAEDIVQEAFTKIWKNRSKLSQEHNIEAYLARSVRNGCINYIQHRHVMDKYLTNYISEEADFDDPDKDRYNARIRMLMFRLPEKRRQILYMSVYESRSYAEIADTLGISLNTVKDHIKKAYAFLRKEADGTEIL